jgi:hypothetical protein
MELVVEKPSVSFDLSRIGPGCLLWGKHSSWGEGEAGIVTSATESQLVVQYHPGIGNITNHFIIPVSEAAEGQWEIRWSKDLTEVFEFGIQPGTDKPQAPEPEEPDKEKLDVEETKPEDLNQEGKKEDVI